MEIRSRAPGKVILSGEHAVVHGSTAVAASIDLYTHVRLTLLPPASGSGDEDTLEIDLKDMDMKFSWPCIKLKKILGEHFSDINIFEPKPCCSEQLDLISKLVTEKNIPESKIQICSGISAFLFLYTSIHGFKPAKAIITSELPLGSGLGSSAAFCVSLSGALIALNEKILINNEIKDWISFKNKELELVNNWAFEGETIIHGKPSGIDNTVSAFGNMIKFRKGEITKLNSTTPIKMLVTDTKTPRNTKHLVSKVSLKTSKLPLTMQSIFNAIDSLSHELATIVESPANLAGDEVAGGGDEVAVCEREERLKEVFEMNMGLLRCIGVSHECIERVIKVTNKENLVSKLTGAGGGGCVLTLIPTLIPDPAIQKVISELELCGFRCFMVQVGGKGLEVCFS